MSNTIPFQFTGSLVVRSLLIDDTPWFVASDICKVLGVSNPRSSLALLDEDEKDVHSVDTPGGSQRTSVINESGLYSLILRSRKPQAKAFKKWVTSEVLPALRKTGHYSVDHAPVERINPGRQAQFVNARNGSLAPDFYPPWELDAKSFRSLTPNQLKYLVQLRARCSELFRQSHKAKYGVSQLIEKKFGAILPDLESWQYGDVVSYLTLMVERAEAFRAQIDSLEGLFFEEVSTVSYRSPVQINLGAGQVFSETPPARR